MKQFFLQIGKTEKLISDDNPTFNQAFEIQYRFEDPQTLQFNVYDVINDMDDEVENDTEKDNQNDISLGEATLSLGQVRSSNANRPCVAYIFKV